MLPIIFPYLNNISTISHQIQHIAHKYHTNISPITHPFLANILPKSYRYLTHCIHFPPPWRYALQYRSCYVSVKLIFHRICWVVLLLFNMYNCLLYNRIEKATHRGKEGLIQGSQQGLQKQMYSGWSIYLIKIFKSSKHISMHLKKF